MKYLIFILFIFFSCNKDNNNSNSGITLQEKQIAKDLIQGAFDDLWAGVDSSKILKYHTADFVILENGEVWDNNRIIEFMKGQLKKTDRPKRTNRMEYISIDKYGPSIQVAYYNFADFSKGDSIVAQAKWLESALAVPTEDGWRLKMMHSTYTNL